MIGADPATILAAVTPVPRHAHSEYQFAGNCFADRGPELGQSRDPTWPSGSPPGPRSSSKARSCWTRTRPRAHSSRSHRPATNLPGGAVPDLSGDGDHPCAASRSISPPTPASRPIEPSVLGEGAASNEVFTPLLRAGAQFPEIVDFRLPPEGCSYRDRGGVDQGEGLPRPRQAGDDGDLVLSAPIHLPPESG